MKKYIIGFLLAMLAIQTPAVAQQLVGGRTDTGRLQSIKVGEDGTVAVSGGAGGGGSTPTGTAGTPNAAVVSVQGISGGTPQPVSGTFWQATQPVSGTFWQATQPVSLASQPLPTGAATETTLSGMSGKLPASLGGKTGATSLSVVAATDGFNTTQITSASSSVGTSYGVSTAVESGRVLKASAGNLYGLNVTSGASAGFVLVFNSTTVPADGAVTPVKCYPLAANTGFDLNYRASPVAFATGISVAFSTTGCFTKTASATAFISGDFK